MIKVKGYIVKQDNEIIAATGDEREAIYIAREYKGVVYKVVTSCSPYRDPTTESTIVYEGTI